MEVPEEPPSLSVSSDSAPPAPPAPAGASFHCAACGITCSGSEPWRQHTQSARHLKLAAQTGGRDSLASQSAPSGGGAVADALPPPPLPGSSTPAGPGGRQYYCEACRVGCSGPEPYKQHVQSVKHMKMVAEAGQTAAAPTLQRRLVMFGARQTEEMPSACCVDGWPM